jgi:tRNA (adenine57-N1/adenine58-N1)-methyltransferase
VIAYESRVAMHPLTLTRGSVHGNRFGSFHHADLIGTPLASKQRARSTKQARTGQQTSNAQPSGWIVLLPFAPDLWTLSLTHRTQILYQADIAHVLMQLDCKPGDVILESGTGSGSLTTALATAVAPHGHVHTFDFNAERVRKARVDFANNGLGDLVTVRERDVVGQGFPVVEGGANAVFLDLPAPWSVVESAARALQHQGRLCSFSPCIEQVQRTCLRLDALGFSEIQTCEVLLRSFEVQAHQTWPVARPTVYKPRQPWAQKRPLETTTTTAAKPAAPASASATEATSAAASPAADDSVAAEQGSAKRMRNAEGVAVPVPASGEDAAAAAASPVSASPAATSSTTAAPTSSTAAATPAPAAAPAPAPAPAAAQVVGPSSVTYVTTKPYQLMRGHTGYLTFATCNKY